MLSITNYKYKSWHEKYGNNSVDISKLKIHKSWKKILDNEDWTRLNKYLTKFKKINIYPYPDLVFNAFNLTPLDKIKVVILGQDPYHNFDDIVIPQVPQAMGLSFSVPKGIKIPSSLQNIYKNLLKYGHIDKIPEHGDLTNWALQGCLMINASLTVQQGCPNSCKKYWVTFTDNIIKYISDNYINIIFVLWGAFALTKFDNGLIDETKHKVIASSHPSGLSNTKTMKSKKTAKIYPAFNDLDHFGEINKFLTNNNMKKIIF